MSMNCVKCGLPKFNGPAGYAAPQCLCNFTNNELIQAAAWHAAQRDIISMILEHTMNRPNPATPVLNRIKGNK